MNITGLAVFFIILLFMLSILSFTSTSVSGSGADTVDCDIPANANDVWCTTIPTRDAIAKINCPLPQYQTDLSVINTNITFYGVGAVHDCHTQSNGVTVHFIYPTEFNSTAFGFIPTGYLAFTGVSLSAYAMKAGAYVTLIVTFISPIGFNIMGYTFASMSGLISFIIIGVYSLGYLFIGLFVYKGLSPFVGGGG